MGLVPGAVLGQYLSRFVLSADAVQRDVEAGTGDVPVRIYPQDFLKFFDGVVVGVVFAQIVTVILANGEVPWRERLGLLKGVFSQDVMPPPISRTYSRDCSKTRRRWAATRWRYSTPFPLPCSLPRLPTELPYC